MQSCNRFYLYVTCISTNMCLAWCYLLPGGALVCQGWGMLVQPAFCSISLVPWHTSQNMIRYCQSTWWDPLITCSFPHFCYGPGSFSGKGQVVQCRCREAGSGYPTVVPSNFTSSVNQRGPGLFESGVRWKMARMRLKRWSLACIMNYRLSPNSIISTASRVFASGD